MTFSDLDVAARATRSARPAERARQHPHRPVPARRPPHVTVKNPATANTRIVRRIRPPPLEPACPHSYDYLRTAVLSSARQAPTSPKTDAHPVTPVRDPAAVRTHSTGRSGWTPGTTPPPPAVRTQPSDAPSTRDSPEHRIRTAVRRRWRPGRPPHVHRPRTDWRPGSRGGNGQSLEEEPYRRQLLRPGREPTGRRLPTASQTRTAAKAAKDEQRPMPPAPLLVPGAIETCHGSINIAAAA